VYGTLMVPTVFRAVLGHRLVRHPAEADGKDAFLASDAVLSGYKKVSPDGTYLYAVPDPQGRIRGYVIGPLPGECLLALRRYEGKNYRQVRLKVQTAAGTVPAVAFVGNFEEFAHSFGYKFRDDFKQEVLLRRKIESALLEDEISRLHTDEELTRRALRELHGKTIRDLVRRHFEAGGISTFAIRQAIREEPMRDFSEVLTDPEGKGVVANYLVMLIRQVVFNQIEDRIFEEFRFDIDQMQISDRFYSRTISALAALRLLNRRRALMDLLAYDALAEVPVRTGRLLDYVRWAVFASDHVYSAAEAKAELDHVQAHMGRGHIPLGAELEFSNIGHDVIRDPAGQVRKDAAFDGFQFFQDFALDILTWKLGGHVDDHHVKASPRRRRGFFELALGSLSVEANISKPITDDPWLLNQIIHAAMEFYDVRPHSLHISLQLRSPNRPEMNRPLPLAVMKCLFALAGDPGRCADGVVRIARIWQEEIVRAKKPLEAGGDAGEDAGGDLARSAGVSAHMLFTQTSRRRSSEEDGDVSGSRGRWVQQFKFLRLSPALNYEPIVMALKGVQVHYKPGTFLTGSQYRTRSELRDLSEQLIGWANRCTPLQQQEIELFLGGVYDGLMHEHRSRPAHGAAYIAYCISEMGKGLEAFNALFK
jgi:hypothetical protein